MIKSLKKFIRNHDNLFHMLRSFRYKNYRLYFLGQGASLIGTWMQQVAGGWLVYRITNSPFMLGLVSFSALIPNRLITPIAGVIADRFDKRKIMYFTQTFLMIFAFILAALVLTNHIKIEYILILTFLSGTMNALDAPTRHSFVYEIVNDKKDLVNAVALNSAMFNGARLVGPALAGILIAAYGEGICFLINGISFLFVLFALFYMKLENRRYITEGGKFFSELKEGFKYSFEFKPIRNVLLLVMAISIFGMPYSTLLPVYVRDILKSGPQVLGTLMASMGLGAFLGAFFIASRKHSSTLIKIVGIAGTIFGFGLLALSLSYNYYLSMLFMFITGFGMVSQFSTANTILQTLSEERIRGRVMSFYNLAFLGMAPIGNLIAGYLAKNDVLGIMKTLFISGIICIIASLLFTMQIKSFKRYIDER